MADDQKITSLKIVVPGSETTKLVTVPVQHTSSKYSWKWLDGLKGLIVGVGTPVLYVLQDMIPNWPLNPIEKAALSAFITYMLKNYFTQSQVTINKADLPVK